MSICIQTSCYQKSYKHLLIDDHLGYILSKFSKDMFDKKQLIVNNMIDNVDIKNINKNLSNFDIYYANDYISETMKFFNISAVDFPNNVMYYSIQHFLGILKCETDYLLHICDDCNIDILNDSFIKECIDFLNTNNECICALPYWGGDINKGAKEESIKETDKFFIASGFSDQLYILKTDVFKAQIYNLWHPDTARYPDYAGKSFESRINSFMKINNVFRAIHKNYYYIPGYYDYKIKT